MSRRKMRASKYVDFLLMAAVIISKTSLVKGSKTDEIEPLSPVTTRPPVPKTIMCINERKRLSSSFIECLNFPENVQQERVEGCTWRFTRSWKKRSRDKPKKTAVCPAPPPAGAITDLVTVCEMASLDMGECQSLADTLIELSTTDETEKTTVCPEDEKVCPFGEVVFRDPNNNCEFPDCPPEPIFCTQDVQECPDGSFVSRDPNNGCAFKPCPAEKITTLLTTSSVCDQAAKECPDGSFVGRNPYNNCQFYDCPKPMICPQDIEWCSDGSYVSRDPYNNCEFYDCPELMICTQDIKWCSDGSYVVRDPYNNCDFYDCPADQIVCAQDVKVCPDGSYVSRDPENGCSFEPCT